MSTQVIPTLLEDKDGNKIVPLTKTNLVTNNDGDNVNDLLDTKLNKNKILTQSKASPESDEIYNAGYINTLGNSKQDTLTAGTGINITNNTISSTITVDQTYSSTSANAQSGVAVASAILGKLDKNQGVAQSGKYLTVGADGNITLTNLPLYDVVNKVYVDNKHQGAWTTLYSNTISSATYSIYFELTDWSYKKITIEIINEDTPASSAGDATLTINDNSVGKCTNAISNIGGQATWAKFLIEIDAGIGTVISFSRPQLAYDNVELSSMVSGVISSILENFIAISGTAKFPVGTTVLIRGYR